MKDGNSNQLERGMFTVTPDVLLPAAPDRIGALKRVMHDVGDAAFFFFACLPLRGRAFFFKEEIRMRLAVTLRTCTGGFMYDRRHGDYALICPCWYYCSYCRSCCCYCCCYIECDHLIEAADLDEGTMT